MPDRATSRRSFLSRLGFGTAAVAATAVVPNVGAPTQEQPSLRPKCPRCGTLMLIREVGRCPNTKCPDYWEPVSISLIGPNICLHRPVQHENISRRIEEQIENRVKDAKDVAQSEEDRGKPRRS